jgi:hypothetical protein
MGVYCLGFLIIKKVDCVAPNDNEILRKLTRIFYHEKLLIIE